MYLEGSDQHRGWFHSSLLESCGTRGVAPFESILSHGFVVDGKGLKMSKSTGNVIAPQDILKKYGADILRIWVASSNYAEDLRIDYSILDQHAESYRKIRNTFRYLLGNIQDQYENLDLEKVKFENFDSLEKFMLHRIYTINENFKNNFKVYNFHNLYKELLNFCTVELSAFYFDIRKDTLYCDALNSDKRKNCITLLNIILQCLLKWFAPILSFTTEEIYQLVKKEKDSQSIHLQNFVSVPNSWNDEELSSDWDYVKKIRDEANISIENMRAEKSIGSSLEATIEIKLNKEFYDKAKNINFSEICITSSASVIKDENLKNSIDVVAKKAQGNKCPICWKIFETSCERPNCGLLNTNGK
jgi:isoleucyl-tRNA synthetase